MKNTLKLFAGTANRSLAEKISEYLGSPLGDLTISRFTNGKCYVKFKESVRGVDAFVIQPTCPPVDTNLVELLILIDALRRASAASVTAVVPYYGCTRQEKKDAPREPITAKLIADIITTGGSITDTLPKPEGKLDSLKVLSVAPLFAEVIRRVHEDESIMSLFY